MYLVIMFIVLALIGGGFAIWYFFIHKKNSVGAENISLLFENSNCDITDYPSGAILFKEGGCLPYGILGGPLTYFKNSSGTVTAYSDASCTVPSTTSNVVTATTYMNKLLDTGSTCYVLPTQPFFTSDTKSGLTYSSLPSKYILTQVYSDSACSIRVLEDNYEVIIPADTLEDSKCKKIGTTSAKYVLNSDNDNIETALYSDAACVTATTSNISTGGLSQNCFQISSSLWGTVVSL